jgi:hypothetical protein
VPIRASEIAAYVVECFDGNEAAGWWYGRGTKVHRPQANSLEGPPVLARSLMDMCLASVRLEKQSDDPTVATDFLYSLPADLRPDFEQAASQRNWDVVGDIRDSFEVSVGRALDEWERTQGPVGMLIARLPHLTSHDGQCRIDPHEHAIQLMYGFLPDGQVATFSLIHHMTGRPERQPPARPTGGARSPASPTTERGRRRTSTP